ncbi:MAG: MMPL family transporter [Tannerella sp.]|jgi:predicted RND superfamily exporter protein|nr:MMPL family transporter [Tannerella sp.]
MTALYLFFRKHRWLLYGLLIISSLLFIWTGSKVHYEEDISKLLPSTQNNTTEGLVFNNLKVKDQLYLLLVPRDSATDAGTLTERCDAFVELLLNKDSATQDIRHILYRMDEDLIRSGMTFLFAHAPAWMDTTLYLRMETLLTADAIQRQMAENYDLIISPSGMAYREVIRHDPVGLRNLFISGDSSMASDGFGGNYKMVYRHFFTPDTGIVLAFLSPNFKSFDSGAGTRLVRMLESGIAEFQAQYPDVEVLFHGAPVQSVFNSRQIKKDLFMTLSISLFVICLVIGICFKNKSTLPMLLFPVSYGAFFALACIYLIQGGMSLMALGIGAIVLGVALSYCLHVLTHYKYVNDPVQVLKDQTTPVFLGCLTTIGAFMGLMFTQSALLRDFGLFASFALVGTTAFSLIFLPHFFNPHRNQRSGKAFAWLDRLNSFPFERQKWLIITIMLFCGICFYTSRWVTFDSDLKHIGYHEPSVVRSQQLLAEKTAGGNTSVYYAAAARDLDSALYYGKRLVMMLDTMQANGVVARHSRMASFIPTNDEQQMRIRHWRQLWTAERIAETRKHVIESGRMYKFKPETFEPFFELLEHDAEPASLYDAGVIPDEWLSNMIEYTDSTYLVFVSAQVPPDRLQEVNDAVAGAPHGLVIDPFYYTSDMVRVINDDFNMVLGISSLFVFVVLLVAFRKLSRAIIAFIPMALSWYVVLGVMGMTGVPFNLINIVISTFIFGIGVDYSIFVMDGLIADARRNDAGLLTCHKTAIFFSAIVLVTGIAPLIFATHPAIRSVGFATLVGMCSTILITYTIEPFLFRVIERWRRKF